MIIASFNYAELVDFLQKSSDEDVNGTIREKRAGCQESRSFNSHEYRFVAD